MKYINDIHKGDVYFSGSDIGWVVGHHFIVYGPLLRGKITNIFYYLRKGTLFFILSNRFWWIIFLKKVSFFFFLANLTNDFLIYRCHHSLIWRQAFWYPWSRPILENHWKIQSKRTLHCPHCSKSNPQVKSISINIFSKDSLLLIKYEPFLFSVI